MLHQTFDIFNTAVEREHPCMSKKERVSYKGVPIPDSFVAVDFEKLNKEHKSACSVGFVKYVNGQVVERRQYFIRPPKEFQFVDNWQKIHGITFEEHANQRTFLEQVPEWEIFIGDLPLAAQNCNVERNCFAAGLDGRETSIRWQTMFDSVCESKRIEKEYGDEFPGEGMHSLSTLCIRYGVPILSHHVAISDAEMCGNVLLCIKAISDKTNEYKPHDTSTKGKFFAADLNPREDAENIVDNIFKEKIVVLTGFTTSDALEYGHLLWGMGAVLKNSLVKGTEIVLCGSYKQNTKTKREAVLRNIRTIGEEEFLMIIKAYEQQ